MAIEHNDSDHRVFPYQQNQQQRNVARGGRKDLDLRHKSQWPYGDEGYQDPYGPRGITLQEMAFKVHNNLTVSCRLPKILNLDEIERIIVDEAAPYFWEEDFYGVQKDFYYVPNKALDHRTTAGVSSVFLPEEVQNVSYIFMIDRRSLFQIGTTPHALSVELGANQAYMPSYLQAIGDFGVYRVTLEGFGDMINELFNRQAFKYSFDQKTGQLRILSEVNKDMILEVYGRIPLENLMMDNAFYRWVVGKAKVQIGNITDRVEFSLPGGTKINGSTLKSEGMQEMKDAEERVQKRSQVGNWFWYVAR